MIESPWVSCHYQSQLASVHFASQRCWHYLGDWSYQTWSDGESQLDWTHSHYMWNCLTQKRCLKQGLSQRQDRLLGYGCWGSHWLHWGQALVWHVGFDRLVANLSCPHLHRWRDLSVSQAEIHPWGLPGFIHRFGARLDRSGLSGEVISQSLWSRARFGSNWCVWMASSLIWCPWTWNLRSPSSGGIHYSQLNWRQNRPTTVKALSCFGWSSWNLYLFPLSYY